MQTIEEIYTLTVRELKPMERLQLATRILKDLRPAQSEQVDYSEEWTEEDFSRARPALDVLPKQVVEAIRRYRGQRGPQRTPTKELISLRVDRDVVAAYRATGPGWQAKANEALRAYAKGAGLGSRARTRRRRIRRTVGAKRS